MRYRSGAVLAAGVLTAAAALEVSTRTIRWADVTPIHAKLAAHGVSEQSFDARVTQIRQRNAQRVREGDLDHLTFYVLQSTRFTKLAAIEPALSAKAYVDSGRVPDDARARINAFVRAADSSSSDPRLAFFRDLVAATVPDRSGREEALVREYERVMRFVYEKEFVAQRSNRPADAVAELYRTRGLSTDTAVEAGYLVYQGLGVVKSLEPARRIRRVLIVGPGLDLAPRTGLLEAGPPESYQPWAVMDALLTLDLARPGDLQVVAADINPRVVEHLRRAGGNPPVLTMTVGIQGDAVHLSDDYKAYFWNLGSAIGAGEGGGTGSPNDHAMYNRVRVRPDAARLLRAHQLDIVTERLDGEPFDLVIATNILPYFGELELMLAMSNVAAMLAPGGVFLHNEPRLSLGEITTAVGLPFNQLRQATIATVRSGPPLADSVFIHLRAGNTGPDK